MQRFGKAVLVGLLVYVCEGLTVRRLSPVRCKPLSFSKDAEKNGSDDVEHLVPLVSRRQAGMQLLAGIAALSFVLPQPVSAKESQDVEDKAKIVKGYQRLSYLLDHWEQETTICGQYDNPYIGKNGCERTPIKVMDYLGYKSTNDPLFKAEKTMRRLEVLVPSDREGEYIEAVEKWTETADEASGMAYVSSWGEANPGGGKDRVEYFIERAKKNVIDARNVLSTVIDILKLDSSS